MLHARDCAIAALLLSACGPDKIYCYVEVATGLELAGATALIGSTCSPSYAPYLERLVDRIAQQLGERCP